MDLKQRESIFDRPVWLFLVAILVVALIVRIIFLYLSQWGFNADEAIIGLMARHILNHTERPLFYYGQNYLGSLEAYLVAAVFYIWGSSPVALKVVPILLSLVFVVLVYVLATQLHDRNVGLLSAVFAAVAPAFLVFVGTRAWGGYIEVLVLGTAILILVHRIVCGTGETSSRQKLYLALGFLSGLGWWIHPLIIYYILTAIIFLILKDKAAFFSKRLGLFTLSFLLGSTPFWLYNFTHSFSFFDEFRGGGLLQGIQGLRNFRDLLTTGVPIILGVRQEFSNLYYLPYAVIILGAVFVGALGFSIYKSRKEITNLFRLSLENSNGSQLLLVFILIVVAVFSLTRFGFLSIEPRYLLALYTAIPIFIADFLLTLKRRSRVLFVILTCFIIFINLYGTLIASRYVQPQVAGMRVPDSSESLVKFLKSKRIKYGYANYWLAYRLTFETNEQIVFSPKIGGAPYAERYPRYTQLVDAEPHPAYLLMRTQAVKFEEKLKNLRTTYKKATLGSYVVYYALSQKYYPAYEDFL